MTWFAPLIGAYAVITTGRKSVTVVPVTDIRQHFFTPECPCEPEQTLDDEGTTHTVHGRFTDKDAIERSMASIFGTNT